MTQIAQAETDIPVVLEMNATDAGKRTGRLLHEALCGAHIRIYNEKLGKVVWVSAEMPEAVRPIAHLLAEPGTVRDSDLPFPDAVSGD